ncbi:MAG: hypothetical protein ACXAC7_06710, partial [Candidatus Hodarchaeales archaeon]
TSDNLLTPDQPENLWSAYRNLALIAIKEYIREFPFLLHSPSSLRACFGMPTRKDRKLGRYSGVFLIDDALNSNYRNEILASSEYDSNDIYPNSRAIEELILALNSIIETNTKTSPAAKRITEYLKANRFRNALKEVTAPPINTHTNSSLEFAKEFLSDQGFNEVIHEKDDAYNNIFGIDEELKLTPDLYGKMWAQPVWIELKQWEKFNVFFKPLKQIFAYMNNSSYTSILVEKPVKFYEFLTSFVNPVIKFDELKQNLRLYLDRARMVNDNALNLKRELMNLGKKLIEEENITYKAEALYLGLISEFINAEIGMANSELEAGLSLFKILGKLEKTYREFRLILLGQEGGQLQAYIQKPRQKLILFVGILNQFDSANKSVPTLR